METVAAAAYLRASSKKQDTSVEEQRKRIISHAKEKGFEISAWYVDDGKSGSRDVEKRTEFRRLLNDAKSAEWRVLLCFDISRFGRLDSLDAASDKNLLRAAAVRLHTVMEGDIDWDSSMGRVWDAMLSEAQHEYSVKLGRNTLQGKLRAFMARRPFGFRTPYGYCRIVTDNHGNQKTIARTEKFTKPREWTAVLSPGDTGEVETVRWIFEVYAREDAGFRWIASQLNGRGVPSPSGRKWCGKVIQEILCNEKYAGHTTLGKRHAGAFWTLNGDAVEGAGKRTSKSHECLRAENTHEAIIDSVLFEAVQKKVNQRKKSQSHAKGPGGYLLKDILYCGVCGRPLYGNPNGKGNPDGRKSGKIIYVCKSAIRYGKQCDCGQWSVKEADVIPVLKRIILHISPAEWQQALMPARELKQDNELIQKEIELVNRKIEKGTERWMDAPDDMLDDIRRQLLTWKEEKARLNERLSVLAESDESQEQLQSFQMLQARLSKTIPTCGEPYFDIGKDVDPKVVRDLLLSSGVQLDFWWKRSSKCRWSVSKVRFRILNQTTEFESPASLIV